MLNIGYRLIWRCIYYFEPEVQNSIYTDKEVLITILYHVCDLHTTCKSALHMCINFSHKERMATLLNDSDDGLYLAASQQYEGTVTVTFDLMIFICI